MLPNVNIFNSTKGVKYALFEHSEVISDVIRANGEWNSPCLEICNSILTRSDQGVVLDIGAGFGSFSVPLALKFPGFKFHAFEPLRPINMQLNANVLLNQVDNVWTYNYGLGSFNEKIRAPILDVNWSQNHGSYSFDEKINVLRNVASPSTTQEYEFKTVDSFNFEDVKLIKISTPGMEFKVLQGMQETLRRNNMPPVLFEVWDIDWYKEENDKVFDFFASRPYEHYMMLGSHAVAFKTKSQSDYLLAKADKTGELGSFTVSEQIHETSSVLQNQAALR